jgi:hypothetical protein
VKGHHLYSRTWNWRIGLASFCSSGEAAIRSLPRTNKVSEMRTVCTYRYMYTYYLLENTSTKHNMQRIYKHLLLGRDQSYFVKKNKKNQFDSSKKFSETDIIIMLEFLTTYYVWWTCFPTDNMYTCNGKIEIICFVSFLTGLHLPKLSKYEADLAVSVVSFISSLMG